MTLESLLSVKDLRIHRSLGDTIDPVFDAVVMVQHPSADINYDLNSLKTALYVETYTYSAHNVPYMCTTF